MQFLLCIDDFYHIETFTGNNTNLIDISVSDFDLYSKLRWFDDPLSQSGLRECLDRVDKRVPPSCLVFISRNFRTPEKLRWINLIRFESGKERLPILVEKLENLLRHLARESPICLMLLHDLIHLLVGGIFSNKDEMLSDLIERCIIKVLGGICCFVDSSITRIRFADHMLLNQLHQFPPLFSSVFQAALILVRSDGLALLA